MKFLIVQLPPFSRHLIPLRDIIRTVSETAVVDTEYNFTFLISLFGFYPLPIGILIKGGRQPC
jgi:hypothetical protein